MKCNQRVSSPLSIVGLNIVELSMKIGIKTVKLNKKITRWTK